MKTAMILSCALLCAGAVGLRAGSTLTLTPASVSLKGPSGQLFTQNFKISNFTSAAYAFDVEVQDVVVSDGTRTFVPAGQADGSLAVLATVPRTRVELRPGDEFTVPVTFVMPVRTASRAVVVFFTGRLAKPANEVSARQRMRLGTVVDFTISDQLVLDAGEPDISPPTATANTVIAQRLDNTGREPMIVKGVAAILTERGQLAGKVELERKRLLPGERNVLRGEFSGSLTPGKYRVLCTLEYGGSTVTKTAGFVAR
jgi:hypothetical protein